jgi:DNA polymerase-3 subunit epsilon
MKLAGFDLETTGFSGSEDHIVQFSFQTWDDSRCISNYTDYVNPGIPITNSEIHGVTNEMVAFADNEVNSVLLIDSLLRESYNNHIPVVIMNAQFDVTFYRDVMSRLGLTPADKYCVIDPFVIDRHFDKYRPGKRTLRDIARVYGVLITDSFHDAEYDVAISINVAREMICRYGLDGSFLELHTSQQKWHFEQQKSLYEYFCSMENPVKDNIRYGWPVSWELMIVTESL